MIFSMTGYGKAVAMYQDRKICVEIRSLNGKSMDLSTRIAPQFKSHEMEIRSLLTNRLERGKVDFTLWVEQSATLDTPAINVAVMQGYMEQIKSISEQSGVAMPENLFEVLLRMPEVIARKEVYEVSDEEWTATLEAVNKALDELVDFRAQEGVALYKKFISNIENITSLLATVEPYEKERIEKIRQRIAESLEKLSIVDYDKNRFEQELIFYIEKFCRDNGYRQRTG